MLPCNCISMSIRCELYEFRSSDNTSTFLGWGKWAYWGGWARVVEVFSHLSPLLKCDFHSQADNFISTGERVVASGNFKPHSSY